MRLECDALSLERGMTPLRTFEFDLSVSCVHRSNGCDWLSHERQCIHLSKSACNQRSWTSVWNNFYSPGQS